MEHEVWVERLIVASKTFEWTLWAVFHDKQDAESYIQMLTKRHSNWKVELRQHAADKNPFSH